jgi:hypothetical protein
MKRLVITYGGVDYTVANPDMDQLKAEFQRVAAATTPTWFRVNHGEGSYRATVIMIGPGIPVAVTGIDAEKQMVSGRSELLHSSAAPPTHTPASAVTFVPRSLGRLEG